MLIPVVRSLSGEGSSATYDELFLDAYPADVVIRWQRLVARNVDSRGTLNEITARQGSTDYLLHAERQSGSNAPINVSPSVSLPGNFRIGVRFTGASAGDKLQFYAFGEIVGEQDQG